MTDFSQKLQEKRKEIDSHNQEATKHASLLKAIESSGQNTATSLATLLAGNDPRLAESVSRLAELLQAVQQASGDLKNSGLSLLPKIHSELVAKLQELPNRVASTDKSLQLVPYLRQIIKAVDAIETSPIIKVDAPDNSSLEKAVKALESALSSDRKSNTTVLEEKIEEVTKAVRDLIKKPVPVPTTTPPFIDATGKRVPARVDGSGGVVLSGSSSKGTADTTAGIAQSTSAQTLLVANLNRFSASIYNNSTANLYIRFALGAALTSGNWKYRLEPYDALTDIDEYAGIITGIWDASGSGYASVGETT